MNIKTTSLCLFLSMILTVSVFQKSFAQSEVDLVPTCNVDEAKRSVICDVRLNAKVPDELIQIEEEVFSKVSVKWPDEESSILPLELFAKSDEGAAWLLLIDQSKSLKQTTIDAIKHDFTEVIRSGKKGENDQIGIGTFAADFALVAPIGASTSDLEQTLQELAPVGDQTLLYAAVESAISELENIDAERKALVIVSDGKAEDPDAEAAKFAAIRAAQNANIVIYSVAYAQEPGASFGFGGMRELAEKTGGPFRLADLSRVSPDSVDGEGFSMLSETYASRFYDFLKNGGRVSFPVRNLEDNGTIQFTISSIPENVDVLPDFEKVVRVKYDGPVDNAGFFDGLIASLDDFFGKGVGLFALVGLIILLLVAITLLVYFAFFRSRNRSEEIVSEEIGPGTDFQLPEGELAGNGIAANYPDSGDDATNIITPGSGGRGEVYGWLEILESGERIPLRQTGLRIGRHEDNDIRFTASTVHRRHAVVHMTPQRDFIITDLSGADGNGVQVNSERIDKAELRDGDLVQFGEVQVKFHAATI
jgi:Mg-chelatase subunit ChlD